MQRMTNLHRSMNSRNQHNIEMLVRLWIPMEGYHAKPQEALIVSFDFLPLRAVEQVVRLLKEVAQLGLPRQEEQIQINPQ